MRAPRGFHLSLIRYRLIESCRHLTSTPCLLPMYRFHPHVRVGAMPETFDCSPREALTLQRAFEAG
jgi:hypothetical protein